MSGKPVRDNVLLLHYCMLFFSGLILQRNSTGKLCTGTLLFPLQYEEMARILDTCSSARWSLIKHSRGQQKHEEVSYVTRGKRFSTFDSIFWDVIFKFRQTVVKMW